MKQCLLLFALVAGLVVVGPAYAQFIFLDVNGDGLNSNLDAQLPDDVLSPLVNHVDVWLDTQHNRNGTTAVCAQSGNPMTVFSYDVTLHTSGLGTVSYNSWTDLMGFNTSFTSNLCPGDFCPQSPTNSPDIWLGRGGTAPGTAGKFKLGTLGITVTGSPVMEIVTSSSVNPNAQTAFGSNCLGLLADFTIRLGSDFFDAAGTEPTTPVLETTWGKIKARYR
jgi:hypothetical protein